MSMPLLLKDQTNMWLSEKQSALDMGGAPPESDITIESPSESSSFEESEESLAEEVELIPKVSISFPSTLGAQRSLVTQRKLYAIWTFHMTGWMCLADARIAAYLARFKGDTSACASFNSRGMMAMMLSNLAIAPTLAKLSDAYGRKSLLVLGSSWCLLLRALELLVPRASTFLLTSSMSAIGNATLQGVQTTMAELFSGDPQGGGGALALLQAGTLAGGVIGPAFGSMLATHGIRFPVAISLLLSAAQLAVVIHGVPETLPVDRRVPFGGLKLANPAACLKLFVHGTRLAAVAAMQLLSYLTEPIMLGRTSTLVNAEEGWSTTLRGQLTSLESAAAIPGFACAGRVVRSSRASWALLASILSKTLQHLLSSLYVKKPWQQFALVPMVAPHGAEQAVLTSMMLRAGAAAGLRQAELQACLQGLQSLGMLLAVFLWTCVFTRCKSRGLPRRFHLGPAAVAAAELAAGGLAVALSRNKGQ